MPVKQTVTVSTAVLIPAHNEEKVIQASLSSVKSSLRDKDTALVIADNCDDNTAAIARSEGVEVIERRNLISKGKGYALDFGMSALQTNPPDIVVVIDADCLVEVDAIEKLKAQVIVTGRPAQAVYLMQTADNPSLKTKISAFAFKVKNLVRPLGPWQYQLGCLLTGTGMAFPWESLNLIDLANGDIVEDMRLGLELAIAGHPPLLCPEAKITGILPSQTDAINSQRTRWEHGHLQTLIQCVPQLFWQAIIHRRLDLLAMGLDLAIPPLSLLVLALTAVITADGILFIATAQWIPLIAASTSGLILITAMLIAWWTFGKEELSGIDLLKIPFYIVWKIPIYLKFLSQPQSQWVKTERD